MDIAIEAPLGSGGHGDVFVGRRRDTGEKVVVKYLRESHLADARRRFAREVRILGKKLRGLVPLLWADGKGDRPYYVMPFLEHGAITKYAGRLGPEQLHTVAHEMAAAISKLHSLSITHGDIKPDNTLVTDDGHLALSDPLGNGWGCTVIFSEEHGGTPGYWAPEIRNGAKISHEGDMYSFGASLHHLATGVVPTDEHAIDLSLVPSSLPTIREIIAACVAPDPAARPSAQDVASLLKGEKWADIQRVRGYWKTGLTVAGLSLLVVALVKGSKGS